MSILVAGVGNIFQGDDAFGCEVASILDGSFRNEPVRVFDFGISGVDLVYALLDAPALTILVDAVSRGGAPGTLYTIEPNLDELDDGDRPELDAHGMNPLHVLRAVKTMGGRLGRMLLVGCEPGDLGGKEGRMGLTPAVAAAVVTAASMVESLVMKELREAKA